MTQRRGSLQSFRRWCLLMQRNQRPLNLLKKASRPPTALKVGRRSERSAARGKQGATGSWESLRFFREWTLSAGEGMTMMDYRRRAGGELVPTGSMGVAAAEHSPRSSRRGAETRSGDGGAPRSRESGTSDGLGEAGTGLSSGPEPAPMRGGRQHGGGRRGQSGARHGEGEAWLS